MKRGLLGLGVLWLAVLSLPVFAKDTVYYYYTDTLHSAVVETDAQGKITERTYYAPYGQVLNRTLRDGPGYTGHEEDPGTDLVYMQQRYYDPESGRFLSTDPVLPSSDGGSFNRYEYAEDNPYTYTDPFGEQSVGEIIDENAQSAANQGNYVATYLWAFAGTAWNILGAESVSQVADKGAGASTSDKVIAAVAIVTLGKGEAAADVGKDIYRGSKLARAMAKEGRGVTKGAEQAHHIVAANAKAAQPARDILAKHGIDINSAVNGAAVRTAKHQSLHTAEYYQRINNSIKAADQAGGKQAVEQELQRVCKHLSDGGC